MDSLKPMLLLVVLGGVGYGVYVALNRGPVPQPPLEVAPDWNAPVDIDMGTLDTKPEKNGTSALSTPGLLDRGKSLPFGGRNAPLDVRPVNNTQPVDEKLQLGVGVNPDAGLVGSLSPPESAQPYLAAETLRDFQATQRECQFLLNENKLADALRELSRWYENPNLPAAETAQLNELLAQLAGSVIYSREHWLAAPHTVQPGETLAAIAEQYQVPWQLLAKINGITNPAELYPGEQLKVIRGPFNALLNRSQNSLTLFVDGMYAGRFPVQGAGEVNKPDGETPVVKFAADDPRNAANSAYISLGGDLHLTVSEATAPAGAAAVRLSSRDMADVFDILNDRSQVIIRR